MNTGAGATAKHTVTKLTGDLRQLPSQLVAVASDNRTTLCGWGYEPASLICIDPTTGIVENVPSVQLPGYMTSESVAVLGKPTEGFIVASGFYHDKVETGWLATVDLIQRRVVRLLNISQPLAFVCEAPSLSIKS